MKGQPTLRLQTPVKVNLIYLIYADHKDYLKKLSHKTFCGGFSKAYIIYQRQSSHTTELSQVLKKRWKGQGLHFLTVPQTLLINDISNEGKIRPWCQCFDHDAIFNDSKKHLRGWSRTIITSLMTSCHQKQHFWWQRWHHWSKGLSFLASPFSHQRRVLMERFWSFMILMS